MKTLTINLPDNLDLEEFEAKMLFAGQLHAKGKITLGQAADIVGISKRAFMEIMGRFGFSIFNYSVEDLEHDISVALGN
jgi:predicted HTH domain antitoxin